jgi:anti-sigma B factor antagonist
MGAMAIDRSDLSAKAVIVSLPHEIDMTNAEQVGQQLRAAFAPGVHVVIADLTATSFCDSAGIRALTHVHAEAAGHAVQLRLAITPDGPVRRVLQLMDLVSFLHIYPSTEAAAGDAG